MKAHYFGHLISSPLLRTEYTKRSEQRTCQLRFGIWNLETLRIMRNVAARLPADVSRCSAQLSAPVEMPTLIRPVTCIMVAGVQRLRLLQRRRLHGKVSRIRRHVTCMVIVSKIRFLYATKKLRQDGLSDCAEPRACRRMVEYSDYSRRLARLHAL